MKQFLYLFFIAALMPACQSKQPQETSKTADTTQQETAKRPQNQNLTPEARLKGFWVGMFGENKINIALTEVVADGVAKGYSVVAGNERGFEGTCKKQGSAYVFDVRETGTDLYDGHFEYTIDLSQPETDTTEVELRGIWLPFDKKLQAKNYILTKREFRYNPEAGNYPETSKRLLTPADLENLFKEDLRIMRNEIYARHGYSFKLKDIRRHFDQQDWYIPMTTDIRKQLSDLETRNANLIKKYEQYAEQYYDEFGR